MAQIKKKKKKKKFKKAKVLLSVLMTQSRDDDVAVHAAERGSLA
jgi:hypothetical protein